MCPRSGNPRMHALRHRQGAGHAHEVLTVTPKRIRSQPAAAARTHQRFCHMGDRSPGCRRPLTPTTPPARQQATRSGMHTPKGDARAHQRHASASCLLHTRGRRSATAANSSLPPRHAFHPTTPLAAVSHLVHAEPPPNCWPASSGPCQAHGAHGSPPGATQGVRRGWPPRNAMNMRPRAHIMCCHTHHDAYHTQKGHSAMGCWGTDPAAGPPHSKTAARPAAAGHMLLAPPAHDRSIAAAPHTHAHESWHHTRQDWHTSA